MTRHRANLVLTGALLLASAIIAIAIIALIVGLVGALASTIVS